VRRAPYLLLDAGGTLVWPNAELLAEAGARRGHPLDDHRLLAAFYTRVHRLDGRLRAQGADPEFGRFLADVVELAGAPRDNAAAILEEAARRSGARSLWTFALPGVAQALEQLAAAGFAMSVVSNSDGTVEQQMIDLGFARWFDRVFDSATLGVAKPDPAILRLVLAELALAPGDCLFVGDVVMVDVACASACGMRAVHLDPLHLYEGWPGLHLADLPALAARLIRGELDLADPRLLALA
jgi:putative hydrolase of the HAD superfamily